MAGRKRRSLIGGKNTPNEPSDPSFEVEDSGGQADGPEEDPFALPTSASEPRHEEPPRVATPDLGFASAPPDDDDPFSFGSRDPDPEPPPAPPPAPAPGPDVREHRNTAGRLYTDHGKGNEDTTDNAWGNSAFASGEPSLPPGWDSVGPMKVEKDYFGGGDDFGADGEEPPTEEAPNAVYEDPSQLYSAPMNVPEPPPIPGLFDRFTPPPVNRKSFVDAPTEPMRPRYEATPPPAPKADTLRKPALPPKPELDDDEEEEEDFGQKGINPMVLIGGGVAVFGVLVMILLLVVIGGGGGDEAPAEAALPPPVEVVKTPPKPPPPPPVDTDAEAVAGADTDKPVPPAVAPPAKSAPAKAAPTKAATSSKPKPKAGADKPAAVTGKIVVRSNRRVLVKVNGQPRDYSPLDLSLKEGSYQISAALPGKPESEQTIEVTLKAGASEAVSFSF